MALDAGGRTVLRPSWVSTCSIPVAVAVVLVLLAHVVDVGMQFFAPARYGDTLRIETTTARLGNRSATLRYRMLKAASGERLVEVRHTVVTCDLLAMRSVEMPADVREIFSAQLEPDTAAVDEPRR